MNFDKVKFKGTFRDYQQKVLDNAASFLSDGRINIVASPGSGKTILGLELICTIKEPTLILSPTTTIRDQWGERFKDWFIDDNNPLSSYFSYSLKQPSLITSITYQALHAVMNNITIEEDGAIEDFNKTNIFDIIKNHGIKTVCLDEAHHLQNEWQVSLEKFISAIKNDAKIISLTATPPYDATDVEWQRYKNTCGEIDDEIFVPQLVSEGTLCPHQDYIYFNYPTNEEVSILKKYKKQAHLAIDEIVNLKSFEQLAVSLLENPILNEDYMFKNAQQFTSLCCLIHSADLKHNTRIMKKLSGTKRVPPFTLKRAEIAVQFLLDDENICPFKVKEEIIDTLKKYDLLLRKKVAFDSKEIIQKRIVSSIGKLSSIKEIVSKEIVNLGSKLRMLILTDHIKKASINEINSNIEASSINVVSIFEAIRKDATSNEIAILSGGLVVVNENVIDEISKLADNERVSFTKKQLNDPKFYEIKFKSDNKHKVKILGKLFEDGYIKVLIGTKSLLGEGWDSPTINSLVLASFVGSFVLSNQMRGRAIRINKNDPNKVSNIWHLVTIEPNYVFEKNVFKKLNQMAFQDKSDFVSSDFEVLKRRFNSFIGPNYKRNVIESGIDRVSIVNQPYDKKKFQQINDEMSNRASNRAELKEKWNKCLHVTNNIAVVSEIEKNKRIIPFTFFNILPAMIAALLESLFVAGIIKALVEEFDVKYLIFFLAFALVVFYFLIKFTKRALLSLSPKKSITNFAKAILASFKEMQLIKHKTSVKISSDKDDIFINTTLVGGSIYEQNIFNVAMTELLSPIDNPRYVMVGRIFKKRSYIASYACPEAFSAKKEHVEILAKHMNKYVGDVEFVYTRNENGRKVLLKCRKKSYISLYARILKTKKKSFRWD